MNITIIGGHGQMGQLFTRLLKSAGHTVSALGESDWNKAPTLLSQADAVIISVPIAITESVIQKTAAHLKPNTLLADFTSNKANPLQCLLAHHAGPVLGLHPIFGPTIESPKDQVIVCCEGRDLHTCQWLIDALNHIGFTLKMMTAEKHDRLMDLIQGLQHFITYCTGVFLKNQNISIQELLDVASPIYRLQLLMLGRIFYQDAGLYADIISADSSRLQTLEHFLKNSQHLLSDLQQGDRKTFIQQFESVRTWMGAFAKTGQDQTDALFNQTLL